MIQGHKWFAISADAEALHHSALVWDMTLPIITPGLPDLKADILRRYKDAGFDFVSITLAVDTMDFEATQQSLTVHRQFVLDQPETCTLVGSADDVLRARGSGRLAVGFHFQGTDPFGEDIGNVERFYGLGVRHALMAYNEPNRVGCGCHAAEDTGLTAFGRRLVSEMNRVGMLVDCAHTGYRTIMETLESSASPVIISHTNARALRDHPRCVPDEVIRACADNGGVMGISGINVFLGEGPATVASLVDHVSHIADLVGPEHVGLGLDYVYDMETFAAFVAGQPERYPPDDYRGLGQLSPEDGPRITAELTRRGYTEAEIRGILGENWLRVCSVVWK